MPETQPEQVDITTVTTLRPPRALTPASSDLLASIRAEGMIRPLVVDRDTDLVSGGRRLMAARALGEDKVWVFRARHLAEACALIAAERQHGVAARPMTFDEQWALVERLQLLKVPGGGSTTGPLAHAVGRGAGWLEAGRRLFRTMETSGPDAPYAATLLDRVRDGSISVYTAGRLLRDRQTGRPSQAVVRLQDITHQYNTLQRIAGQLTGMSTVMDGISPVVIPPDQAAEIVKQMTGPHSSLNRLLRRLKDCSNHE